MFTQEVSPEQFAKLFHHYHKMLAAGTRESSSYSDDWNKVPGVEKERMIAAARLAFRKLTSSAEKEDEQSRYFARPGQAEWGC